MASVKSLNHSVPQFPHVERRAIKLLIAPGRLLINVQLTRPFSSSHENDGWTEGCDYTHHTHSHQLRLKMWWFGLRRVGQMKAFQLHPQFSVVLEHREVRAQAPSFQNHRFPLQSPKTRGRRLSRWSLIAIFKLRPQEPRTHDPTGLGAKSCRMLPGRLFLISLIVFEGTFKNP